MRHETARIGGWIPGVLVGFVTIGAPALAAPAAGPPGPAADPPRPAAWAERATLTGLAVLPAAASPGPTSGQFIEPANGVNPPFQGSQPLQGVSSVIPGPRPGHYFALQDNGFGSRANSSDALLRWFEVEPQWRTARGGAGRVLVRGIVAVSDPDGRTPFPTVAAGSTYPSSAVPVAREIHRGRRLTGADFDPESFRRLPDGTFWLGDEFGPWLLHVDARGRLLEAPVGVPGVRSPEHPDAAARGPTLRGSRGFEGLALSPDGATLWAMLEGTVAGDPEGTLRIYEFDTRTRTFVPDPATGEPRVSRYRLESPQHAIGELAALDARRFVVIERDGREGAEAAFKRIFRIDLDATAADGTVAKTLLVDLLDVADPDDLDRDGSPRFRFPFTTIESVLPLDDRTLLVACDNNYPFGAARVPGTPDATEFILLDVPNLADAGATR